MDSEKKIQFISQQIRRIRPNKKKEPQTIYSWKLERLKESMESFMDVFPSTPADDGIQQYKEEIISNLNTKNLFDFEYIPKERDFLSIQLKSSPYIYLNLIFIEEQWIEEYYVCNLRGPADEYIVLKNGSINLEPLIK